MLCEPSGLRTVRVALDIRDQASDIRMWDLSRQSLTRLTFDPMTDGFPLVRLRREHLRRAATACACEAIVTKTFSTSILRDHLRTVCAHTRAIASRRDRAFLRTGSILDRRRSGTPLAESAICFMHRSPRRGS